MELKMDEYRMTNVGLIPKDWSIAELSEVAEVKTGPFGSSLHESDYVNIGTPIITVEHLGEQGVNHNNLPLVSEIDKKRLSSYILQTGDIVFSRVGSVDRNSLISDGEKGWLFSGRLLRIRVNLKKINPAYLSFYFNQESTKQRVRSVAVGQTMASLNTQILKNIEIAFPTTIVEQELIAITLSDVNELLTEYDKLIIKKKNIKKGVEQKLLTPKKEWVTKKLSECFKLSSAKSKSNVLSQGGKFIVMDMGSVSPEGKIIKNKRTNYFSDFLVAGELVMPKDDIGGGNIIGKIAYIDESEKFVLGDHVYKLSPIDKNIDSLFISFLINSKRVSSELRKKVSGSAQLGLGRKSVEEQEIFVPLLKNEQQYIATILNNMDKEIILLEKKRAKLYMIKKGMMQNLFTGKIRLVNTDINPKIYTIDSSENIIKPKHNWEFNEAVLISVLTQKFATPEYPLGRKRYTKLSYLFHRYKEREAEGYLKKAAGPYNPKTKYGGVEKIALNKKYIKLQKNDKFSGFIVGENINEALEYFIKWYQEDILSWLEQFRMIKNDTLELWTTVDMAMQEISKSGKEVSVNNIKKIIIEEKEWKDKLNKSFFSDENIIAAVNKSNTLFGKLF